LIEKQKGKRKARRVWGLQDKLKVLSKREWLIVLNTSTDEPSRVRTNIFIKI
jgi:hypothetical protein